MLQRSGGEQTLFIKSVQHTVCNTLTLAHANTTSKAEAGGNHEMPSATTLSP